MENIILIYYIWISKYIRILRKKNNFITKNLIRNYSNKKKIKQNKTVCVCSFYFGHTIQRFFINI